MLANPLAVLYPIYSSVKHTLSFAIARPREVVSTVKFARDIKGPNVYLGLVNAVAGKLDYIHHSAYDS